MTRHVVGTVEEIPPGQRKVVEVGGRSIGVFNVGGTYYALRNSCPHQGGPLCAGRLTGFLHADAPGAYTYTQQGEILRCPWHGWEFDVKNGQSWFDPVRTRVRSYEVRVEAGSGLQKGPYVAETYDVTVEQNVVVVDVPGSVKPTGS